MVVCNIIITIITIIIIIIIIIYYTGARQIVWIAQRSVSVCANQQSQILKSSASQPASQPASQQASKQASKQPMMYHMIRRASAVATGTINQ